MADCEGMEQDNHQLNQLIEEKIMDEDRLREEYQLVVKQVRYLEGKLEDRRQEGTETN